MCHVAPFLKAIKGAKFEQCHYFIFRDIFDYGIHLLMEPLMTDHQFANLHNTKT